MMLYQIYLTIAGKAPPGRLWRSFKRLCASWVLAGPAVLLFAGFVIAPAVMGFGYSLTDWTGWEADPQYVGLDNFREVADDEDFVDFDSTEQFFNSAVGFTLFMTLWLVGLFTCGSLVLAVLLDRLRSMKGLIRGMFFYPFILSIIVSALLLKYMGHYSTDPAQDGAINQLLTWLSMGSARQEWTNSSTWAPYFILSLCAWAGTGFFTTIYLANLQTIPQELYEAARIDGAGPFRIFTKIQIPMLMPGITTVSVLAVIGGINIFPQILVTTQGGPNRQTMSVGYYIYQLGWDMNRQGYASAISFILFVAVMIVAFVQVSLLRRKRVQV